MTEYYLPKFGWNIMIKSQSTQALFNMNIIQSMAEFGDDLLQMTEVQFFPHH
jgi:hypothetical protein